MKRNRRPRGWCYLLGRTIGRENNYSLKNVVAGEANLERKMDPALVVYAN